jgi:tetratricopeptide (TPR) repeat protein
VDAHENLERALALYRQARELLRPDTPEFAAVLQNEAIARLARLGGDRASNLKAAIDMFEQARSLALPGTLAFTYSLLNEADALTSLAELGVQTRPNLERAVGLYSRARALLPEGGEFTSAVRNEADARARLAEQ